jgi:hypothetical protein
VTAREQFDRGYEAGNYDAAYASVPFSVALRVRQRAGTRTAYAREAYEAARAYAYGHAGATPHTHPAPRSSTGGGQDGAP